MEKRVFVEVRGGLLKSLGKRSVCPWAFVDVRGWLWGFGSPDGLPGADRRSGWFGWEQYCWGGNLVPFVWRCLGAR